VILALIDVYSYLSAREEVFDALRLAETVVERQREEMRTGQREILRLKKLRDDALRILKSREKSEQTFRNFTSLLEGYPRHDYDSDDDEDSAQKRQLEAERLRVLKEALARLREKGMNTNSRKEIKVVFYSPQPRTNRHGEKQSLYPHDVYSFWSRPLQHTTTKGEGRAEWVEWDCDVTSVKCLYGAASTGDAEGVQSLAKDAHAVLFFFPKTFRTAQGSLLSSSECRSTSSLSFNTQTLERKEMLDAIAPKKKGQKYVLANIEPNVIEYQLLTGECMDNICS